MNHCIDMGSSYRYGLMLETWILGRKMDLWYRYGLMVFTTAMVLAKTHGIVSVLLNHRHMRGPSFARMRDFCCFCTFKFVTVTHILDCIDFGTVQILRKYIFFYYCRIHSIIIMLTHLSLKTQSCCNLEVFYAFLGKI